jgi:hypothetical protein
MEIGVGNYFAEYPGLLFYDGLAHMHRRLLLLHADPANA